MPDPRLGRLIAVLALLLGCQRATMVAVIDPYWREVVGPQRAEDLLAEAARRERVALTTIVPPSNTPPIGVLSQIEAIPEPFDGVILSPLYAGAVFQDLRSRKPNLPVGLLLAPPPNPPGRTAAIQFDFTEAYRRAGRQALRSLRGHSGKVLAVLVTTGIEGDARWRALQEAWKEAPEGLSLEPLSFAPSTVPNAVFTVLKGRLEEAPPAALLLLTGPMTSKLLPLLLDKDIPYAVEVFESDLILPRPPLFQVAPDWAGLLQRAFVALLRGENGLVFFSQIEPNRR